MRTLSRGIVPEDLTIGEPYPMQLNVCDAMAVAAIVNQGIDSHLEAVCTESHVQDGKLHVTILDDASMRCFLRRCVESDDENTQDLASCIMQTLGIEWI